MHEKFPTSAQEHPTEKEIRANFESSEKGMTKGVVDFLGGLEEERFKNKAASALLALSLFAGASSSFAEGQESTLTPASGAEGESVVKMRKVLDAKNNIADFDWGKIVPKIEISLGGKKEDIKSFKGEAISTTSVFGGNSSEFYKNVTTQDIDQANLVAGSAVLNAQNSAEFFKNLETGTGGMTSKQKAIMLQLYGAFLAGTANFDMFNANTHVSISEDVMFQALKEEMLTGAGVSGICGNIHTFLTKMAQKMGVEAFLQSGSAQGGRHVWSGLVLGDGAEKQIAFLDYGTLLPTGTLNYKDALGVAERYHKSVSLFNNYVGDEKQILFTVKSRASEVVERAAGIKGAGRRLEDGLKVGEVAREGRGLEVALSSEVKEIKLNADSVGLAFFNFEDAYDNPYQSLKGLNAFRVGVNAGGETLGLSGSATVLNMNVKDLEGGTSSMNDIVGNIAAHYLDKKQLTKNEYGEFVTNFGATFEMAMKQPLTMGERVGSKKHHQEFLQEGALGARMIYLDPYNVGKFYVGASESVAKKANDFERQESKTQELAKSFALGAEVKVFEGIILGLDLKKNTTEWGSSTGVNVGVTDQTARLSVAHEKKHSDYERFVPSSEKIEASLGYQIGPKWEVLVIGAKTKEHYKDAPSHDATNFEVKMRVLLW